MLHTQPIKAARTLPGEYVSVMSRHTLSDGVTPDPQIDLRDVVHLPILAPPPRLVGDWYKGRLGEQNEQTFQEEFTPRYLDWLRSHEKEVTRLGEKALVEEVVVMCIESTPAPGELLLCHRRLLAQVCLQLTSGLEVDIR